MAMVQSTSMICWRSSLPGALARRALRTLTATALSTSTTCCWLSLDGAREHRQGDFGRPLTQTSLSNLSAGSFAALRELQRYLSLVEHKNRASRRPIG